MKKTSNQEEGVIAHVWPLPFSELSPQQQRVVRLSPLKNHLVLGASGSGKTLVILHRAAHLVEDQGLSQDLLRIFVLTDVVKELVRLGLRAMNLSEETAVTLDDWCRVFYLNHISSREWSTGYTSAIVYSEQVSFLMKVTI